MFVPTSIRTMFISEQYKPETIPEVIRDKSRFSGAKLIRPVPEVEVKEPTPIGWQVARNGGGRPKFFHSQTQAFDYLFDHCRYGGRVSPVFEKGGE